MKHNLHVATILAVLLAGSAAAQAPGPQAQAKAKQGPRPMGTEDGLTFFQTRCMGCHGNPAMGDKVPTPSAIPEMSPEKIYESLTTGSMKTQGDALNEAEKTKLAEFMGGYRPLGSNLAGDPKNFPNRCAANPAMSDPSTGAAWNG